MNPTIMNPKVFISYAWGSKEHQDRVLTLARDLSNDGIEVLLDKWSLKEGYDTYAYMEKSVNDPEVTNVLILLDPIYAQKANDRYGGVGTETQIISPEIYNKVTQEKFLPVVLERGENGEVPKPAYLKSLLHFDLSKPDRYDEEYQRLVKRLYGVEIIKKPDLGKMPSWVTEETTVTSKTRTAMNALKQITNVKEKRAEYIEYLSTLRNNSCEYSSAEDGILAQYEGLKVYRDEYLQLLKISTDVDDAPILGDFFQELYDDLNTHASAIQHKDLKQVLLHEMFIYAIAFLFKTKNYPFLEYMLNRTFFGIRYGTGHQETGFRIFYHYSQALNTAKNTADDKKYFSGTAQHWIDNIVPEICNKKEFVFADVLMCNYGLYGKNYKDVRLWFPITYVYGQEEGSILQKIAYSLKSLEVANRWMHIFGHKTLEEFRGRISEANAILQKDRRIRPRYGAAFNEVELIDDYVTAAEIGSLL